MKTRSRIARQGSAIGVFGHLGVADAQAPLAQPAGQPVDDARCVDARCVNERRRHTADTPQRPLSALALM